MTLRDLIIIMGLPGSGKTTRALRYVAESPTTRIRSSRDDIGAMAFGNARVFGDPHFENAITAAQHEHIRRWLRDGWEVIVDATNLVPEHARALCELAIETGAGLQTWDLTYVDVETCIDNDAARRARGERYVGEEVIRDKHQRWLTRRIEDLRHDLADAVAEIDRRFDEMRDNGWDTWKADDYHMVIVDHASQTLVDEQVRKMAERVATTGRHANVVIRFFDSLSGLPGSDDLGGSALLADLLGAGFDHVKYRHIDVNTIPGSRP